MYPRELADDDVESIAEPKVFTALRDGLSDEWEVFHSASWVARDAAKGFTTGEIDFVLCHPDKGILCLEVKGGGIQCRHGDWWRTRRGQPDEHIKEPFTQALDHRFALERQISKVKGWKGSELFIAHALAFPLTTIHQLALAPDAPRQILIDRNDLQDVAAAIDRVLDFHRGAREKRRAPGPEGAEMLRNLLAPQIRIRVPMAEEFLEEEEAIVLLTREQSLALRRMARNPRMVITGCAGSGKTILAVEHARRLAADGKDVLFVCFNRRLAEFLRKRERNQHTHFFTFHGLCTHLARKAGVELSEYPQGEAPPGHFDEELPDALVEAVGILGEQYDALIVDEAQDLHTDWLED